MTIFCCKKLSWVTIFCNACNLLSPPRGVASRCSGSAPRRGEGRRGKGGRPAAALRLGSSPPQLPRRTHAHTHTRSATRPEWGGGGPRPGAVAQPGISPCSLHSPRGPARGCWAWGHSGRQVSPVTGAPRHPSMRISAGALITYSIRSGPGMMTPMKGSLSDSGSGRPVAILFRIR